jgi:hypothetical protein
MLVRNGAKTEVRPVLTTKQSMFFWFRDGLVHEKVHWCPYIALTGPNDSTTMMALTRGSFGTVA